MGTGFKDDDLARLFEKMRALVGNELYTYIHTCAYVSDDIKTVESKKKPYNYNVGDGLIPDDWFQVSHTYIYTDNTYNKE